MKTKILSLLLIVTSCFFFFSCSKTEKEDLKNNKITTTYTVDYLIDMKQYLQDAGLIGASVEETVVAKEYNDKNECVNIQSGSVTGGSHLKYTAGDSSKKVTVCYKVSTTYGGKTLKKTWWLPQVIYLEIGKNTIITIDENTRVSDYEPL